MARISLNRVCSRAVQDKFYQLLINRNQSTIYQQTQNSPSTVNGTFVQSKTNGFQNVGSAPFARNTQVNHFYSIRKIYKIQANHGGKRKSELTSKCKNDN